MFDKPSSGTDSHMEAWQSLHEYSITAVPFWKNRLKFHECEI